MLIQFGVESGFYGQFDQFLSEYTQILLGFDILGQLRDQRFQFVLIHCYTHNCPPVGKVKNYEQLHNLIYRLSGTLR